MPGRALGMIANVPPVGVLASTKNIASSIARELNIKNAFPLSPLSLNAGRGVDLAVLLVDDSAWPISEYTKAELLPCLKRLDGYILRITRHDPKKKIA